MFNAYVIAVPPALDASQYPMASVLSPKALANITHSLKLQHCGTTAHAALHAETGWPACLVMLAIADGMTLRPGRHVKQSYRDHA